MKGTLQTVAAGFFMALSFLTVLPAKRVDWDGTTTRHSLYFFPVCGLLVGGGTVGIVFIVSQLFMLPSYLLAFITIVSMLLFYGGLHLDGWMDISDAIGSWRDQKQRLEILKDSHVGATAVWSVIVLLSCRFFSIMYMIETDTSGWLFLTVFIPVLSRTWMGHMIISQPLAKKDGLAAWFQKHTNDHDSLYIFSIALLIIVVLLLLNPYMSSLAILLVVTSVGAYLIACRFFYRLFGGINGDMAGAWLEGGETVLWFTSVLFFSFVMA